MSTNETVDSSSTSSYSSAEGTPNSSPLKKPSNRPIEQKSDTIFKTTDVISDQSSAQISDSKRSCSDSAMIAINGTKDKLHHQRSRSDCDDLIQTTRARMAQKFDQLEQESGLKLTTKKKSNSNECKEVSIKEESIETIRCVSIEVKEQAYNRMSCELSRAQNQLKLKDEEVVKLSKIREEVESELEDLTASLFEEANLMVYNANVLRTKAQKELYEANLKIEVLQAEVQALKMLVLTSTPSNHSSVRANGVKSVSNKQKASTLAKKSPSNYELGTNTDKFDSIVQNGVPNGDQPLNGSDSNSPISDDYGEVDPLFHEEFLQWKKCPNFEPMNSDFIKRIYDDEVYPVFNFKDKDLTARVLRAIEDNTIIIEAVSDKSPFPKRCALLDAPRNCKYRMKIGDNWHNISQLCRNRIIAVCDLFCYLRYIQRGLVKSSFHEVFWEVMRRRRNIALSRLGFSAL